MISSVLRVSGVYCCEATRCVPPLLFCHGRRETPALPVASDCIGESLCHSSQLVVKRKCLRGLDEEEELQPCEVPGHVEFHQD